MSADMNHSPTRTGTRPADIGARVYEALRSKAIHYQLRPGEHVNEVALAAELNVSRTPVREALNRLVSEGLMTLVPNKGFFREPLDIDLIRSLFELRSAVEVLSVKLFCARASDEELNALRKQWNAVKSISETLSPASIVEHDEAFHSAIARGSRNQEVIRILGDINSRIRFVRMVAMETRKLHKITFVEHDEILEALFRLDADGAGELMQRHIGLTLDDVTRIVKESVVRIYLGEEVEA
jgi:DNA-binding GntR family transcriptional regulator